jgi:Right handed beta helix region
MVAVGAGPGTAAAIAAPSAHPVRPAQARPAHHHARRHHRHPLKRTVSAGHRASQALWVTLASPYHGRLNPPAPVPTPPPTPPAAATTTTSRHGGRPSQWPTGPAAPAPTVTPKTPAPTSTLSTTPITAPTPTPPLPRPVVAPRVGISGTTYYVSASGSDSNSGTTPGQAWQTVGRVNRASLAPGDGVLFAGAQTFSDSDLEPAFSGSAAAPIVYGSYGSGNATITKGAWFVQDHLVFSNLTFNATFFGGSEVHGASNSITLENCTISLPAGNSSLGVYTNGQHWTIVDNTIQNTGLSGLLLNGDDYQVAGNTINNVGLDTSAGYNAHGVYLDASNATITNNTITNFSESAVSARYHDSVVIDNFFSGGQIGIDFYQTDPVTGTSRWTQNTIQNTTDVGIYVSSDGVHNLGESFVISQNSIKPSTGGYTNLKPTRGNYSVSRNLLTH